MLVSLLSLALLPACQPQGEDTAPVDTGSDCDFSADPCDSGEAWITTCDVYPTIQAALDAATNGTTVHVCAGTHLELLEVGEEHADEHINLDGEGSGTTLVDAAGEGPVLRVGPGVDLDVMGLTLTGAGAGSSSGVGGALYLAGTDAGSGSVRMVMSDVALVANTATEGAGLYAFYADLRLTQCSVTGNTSDSGPAAVLSDSSLQSAQSNWGEGADENVAALAQGDVGYPDGALYTYGSNASFTCSADTMLCVDD